MSVSSVEILATGARTPIGLFSASSAAALRAGIMRVREHEVLLDREGEPVMGSMDAKLDPELMGPQRLLSLLDPVLHEVHQPLQRAMGSARSRLPLLLALPEHRPGFGPEDVAWLEQAIARLELPFDPLSVTIAAQGHAAGLSLLAHGKEQITRGMMEACVVAGVDSYFDAATVKWLDRSRQLASSRVRSGFVPGEGAGACLLASSRVARSLGLSSMGTLLAAATAQENKLNKSDDICLGEGLIAAVRSCIAQLDPGRRITDVICDINGERYRSEEWGFASLQTWQSFDDPSAFRSPADTWGDMGAASGPLFVMLACQAALRGYARGPTTMIWTSSEGGLRATAVLGSSRIQRS
jgi:3-oxoacyl-[acyl-carrier-protein] synthase I